MANTRQATKRVRQNRSRRTRNVALRTKYRTYLKRARSIVAAGADGAGEAYADFVRVADSVSRKGIIPANRTARLKSRLVAEIKRAGAQAAPAARPESEAADSQEA